jgi:MFS family permease
LIVMAMSALAVLFTPEERPKAVGIWAAVNFVSFPIGPILGGYILSHAWWGWVFLMNVPVALLGLIAVLALVPETKVDEKPGLDPAGVVLSTAGLVGLTYGLIQAGQNGWGSAERRPAHGHRGRPAPRLPPLGGPRHPPPRRPAARRHRALPLAQLHLGRAAPGRLWRGDGRA